MSEKEWTKESAGDGRYHVRGVDGMRRPGLVIGGRRRWAAELGGRAIGYYATAEAACAALWAIAKTSASQ